MKATAWNDKMFFIALAVVLALWLCPAEGVAEEEGTGGGEPVPDEVLSPGEEEKDYWEQQQESWSERIQSTASWMDSFFDDERFRSTSNKTYVRLRATPILDRHGLSLSTYVDVRLLLPNTERWLFSFGGDPDAESRYGSSPLEEQERKDEGRDERNGYMGLSTFFKRTRTRNVRMGGGVSFRNRGIVPYGSFRWTELWEFRNWDLRAMQRLRYYTDTGPEFKSQLDADWPILHKFLLRGTASVLLKKDDPAVWYEADATAYQYLTTRQALEYQIRTGYVSEPGRAMHLSSVNYEVRYRRQLRDWFSTTLSPGLSQHDSDDWKLHPGIRLDFSIRLGQNDMHRFVSPYEQKQKNLQIKDREDRERNLEESHRLFMERSRESEEKEE